MLIILDVRYSLCEITIWADSRCVEAVLDLTEELFDNGYPVFAHNDTLHFDRLDLAVPLVVSDVINGESFHRISIQDFLDEFF